MTKTAVVGESGKKSLLLTDAKQSEVRKDLTNAILDGALEGNRLMVFIFRVVTAHAFMLMLRIRRAERVCGSPVFFIFDFSFPGAVRGP